MSTATAHRPGPAADGAPGRAPDGLTDGAAGTVPDDAPLLLAVDGNSLLHRAHHAHAAGQHRDAAGRPVWALRGVVSLIASAAARLGPDALVVGFDCTERNERRAAHPAYKAHRPEKHADLRAQLDDAPALLAAAGLPVVVAPGHEADDVLASAAALARRSGWRCTAVTSDRDAFALVDASTSVLRVIAGGIGASPVLTARTMPLVTGVRPEQYRCLAALRGDTSDNLPGVTGIGAKTAARLLAAFDSTDAVFAALDEGRDADVAAAAGARVVDLLRARGAREGVALNQRLMAMRDDLDLPTVDDLRLPLDLARVQSALGARDVRLGPSLWALVGGSPPAEHWAAAGLADVPAHLADVPPADDEGGRWVPVRPAPPAPVEHLAPVPHVPMGATGLAKVRKDPGEDQLSLFG